MLIPGILAIYGIAKSDNKSAADRRKGKTALKVAAVWGAATIAIWAYSLHSARKIAHQTFTDPEEVRRNSHRQRSALIGLPLPR